LPENKISSHDVARQTLDGVQRGNEEVLTDDSTRHVKASLPNDQELLYADVQKQWDAGDWPWKD